MKQYSVTLECVVGDDVILMPHGSLVVLCLNNKDMTWIQAAVQYAERLLDGKCMFIRKMVGDWGYRPDGAFVDALRQCEALVDGAVATDVRAQLRKLICRIKDIVSGRRLESGLADAYLCGYPDECLVQHSGKMKQMLEWRISTEIIQIVLDIVVKPFERICCGDILEGVMPVLAYGLSLDSTKLGCALERASMGAAPKHTVINSGYGQQLLAVRHVLEQYWGPHTVLSDAWIEELECVVL